MTTARNKPGSVPGPAPGGDVACPKCGARYRWKPELAGRSIRCKHCQSVFKAEAAAEGATVAAVERAGARGGYAMLAHRVSRRAATEEEELTVVHNWVLPLVVLGLGAGWRLWQAIEHAGRYESVALWESLGLVTLEWVVVSIAVAGGVFVSAMFIEIDIDKVGRAILKVTSTALLMCAVANFCSSFDKVPGDLIGMIQGVPCILILAYLMVAGMFGVDLMEGLMGTVAITVFAVGVMVALALSVQTEAGSILGFGRPVVG